MTALHLSIPGLPEPERERLRERLAGVRARWN
jgi:hypothetical protein